MEELIKELECKGYKGLCMINEKYNDFKAGNSLYIRQHAVTWLMGAIHALDFADIVPYKLASDAIDELLQGY